jgi:hypothetical protein
MAANGAKPAGMTALTSVNPGWRPPKPGGHRPARRRFGGCQVVVIVVVDDAANPDRVSLTMT